MKLLGISGLEGSVSFKKAHWPGLDEREYRISQGHDSAAALIVDGVCVAAAAEERFSRKKHTGDFPAGAISYCLSEAGLAIEQVDEIAHGFDYAPYRMAYPAKQYKDVLSRESLAEHVHKLFPAFPAEHIHPVQHHLAHAASAFCTSGWDDCLVVVIDGMGEAHSASIYHARDNKLQKLHQIPANDSIGILYSLVTLHLGFDFNSDEYKIMGLAPYGNPARFRSFFDHAVVLEPNGSIQVPILRMNRSREERENYAATRRYLAENLVKERKPDDEIREEHWDVAAALQECLDKTIRHICQHFGAQTGLKRLAMAGGVALNCTENGKLLRSALFDDIYVQPAAGDDGTALGAALFRAMVLGENRNGRFPVPFLGPAHPMSVVNAALAHWADRIEVERYPNFEKTCAVAAERIANGQVVAWYRGRMEFGPRALGHRSILADPGHPEMRDRINAMVKMREAFRPFAPACSEEEAHRWFNVAPGTQMPYMITVVDVRPEHRASLPAITHVNGSARLQTVSEKDNHDFHRLLKAVGQTTGRRMVLNTSFNVKGQPIVNLPEEAIETFLSTGIEFLFLEDRVVARRDS